MEELLQLIEGSAAQLVMTDATNLQGLAKLHDQFELINRHATEITDDPNEYMTIVQSASAAAANMVENIILDDVDDIDSGIKTVEDIVKSLCSLVEQVVQGQEPINISFPEELGISLATDDNINNGTNINLPQNIDEEIFREFLSNQPEVLANLESLIIAAEKNPAEENILAIKAILHNLKGESGLLGLQEIASVCHETESLLENYGSQFPVEKLLDTKDWFHNAISVISGDPNDTDNQNTEEIITENENDPETSVQSKPAEQEDSLIIAENDVPLVIDFVSESNEHLESAESDLLTIEENPEDMERINSIFRAFHTIKGVAGFLNLKQIGSLAHATENLLDLARKGELTLGGISVDLVFEAMDVMKRMLAILLDAVEKNKPVSPQENLNQLIDRIKACSEGKELPSRLGELLVQNGSVSANEIRNAVKDQKEHPDKKIGEILVENNSTSNQEVNRIVQQQNTAPNTPIQTKKVTTESTVKVTTERLDIMINMVGELVIAQSMVSQDLGEAIKTNQRLERNSRHLDKITRDLQELSMSMRMVPVHGVFQKMARLVRDLSRKSGKEIEFVMTGAETELDRNVVEAIADPLVHMIRNSVDHGIETPQERKNKGKNPSGKVELKAYHKGGNIVIEIVDDGKGLDRERILNKAIQNGIVKEGQEMTDQEVYRLIFHAGLSTAEKVTSISGRGVGMDVVRKNIESLRGRVDIDSKPGQGTIFSIALPLTLAVIDGQIVTIAEEKYIIPTISIVQNLHPAPDQISTTHGGKAEMMLVRGEILPLVRLYKLFDIEPEFTDPCDSLVVVVTDGDKRCCIQVDSLLGQQQVVIKSLGEYLGSITGVSGGAIMGDGNVSLILDIPGLINMAINNG